MEVNYFTILWWFLPHIDMNQSRVHVCPPILNPPPISLPTPSLWVVSFECPASCIKNALVIYFTYGNIHATAKSLQSCQTLCDPIDSSLPGSSIPGILQARMLEWVTISFSNAWKWKVKVKSLSCVWLMDCSPLGFSIHGTFQARVLEWSAIAFSTVRS